MSFLNIFVNIIRTAGRSAPIPNVPIAPTKKIFKVGKSLSSTSTRRPAVSSIIPLNSPAKLTRRSPTAIALIAISPSAVL